MQSCCIQHAIHTVSAADGLQLKASLQHHLSLMDGGRCWRCAKLCTAMTPSEEQMASCWLLSL